MKKHVATGRGPQLVTAAAAPAIDDKRAQQIAEGVLKFQTLQDAFDAEAFSKTPDLQHAAQLVMEMNTLRGRLAAHGVRV